MKILESKICKVCSSTNIIFLKEIEGYKHESFYSVHNCKSCNTNFVLPCEIDGNIYEVIYEQGQEISGYERYFSYANDIKLEKKPLDFLAEREPMYWAVRKALGDNSQKNSTSKILEVGSGLGYMTYALAKEGYNIEGLDISKNAVDRATNRFGDLFICDDIFNMVLENNCKYDFIILNEVIEHVKDPNEFIKCLLSLIKTTGKILVTTPNKSIAPGSTWDSELPPVHLYWLSEESLMAIAKNNDAKVEFVDFTNFSLISFDSQRYKQYKPMIRIPTIDSEGIKVINLKKNSNKPKAWFIKFIKNLLILFSRSKLYRKLFFKNDYPLSKSNTIGAIFSIQNNNES